MGNFEILLLQENVFDKSCWVMIMTGLSVTYSLAWLGNKILYAGHSCL